MNQIESAYKLPSPGPKASKGVIKSFSQIHSFKMSLIYPMKLRIGNIENHFFQTGVTIISGPI